MQALYAGLPYAGREFRELDEADVGAYVVSGSLGQ